MRRTDRPLRSVGADYLSHAGNPTLDGPVCGLLARRRKRVACFFALVPARARHRRSGLRVVADRFGRYIELGSKNPGRRLRRLPRRRSVRERPPLLSSPGLLLASMKRAGACRSGLRIRNLIRGTILLPAAQYPGRCRVARLGTRSSRGDESRRPWRSRGAFADWKPAQRGVNN